MFYDYIVIVLNSLISNTANGTFVFFLHLLWCHSTIPMIGLRFVLSYLLRQYFLQIYTQYSYRDLFCVMEVMSDVSCEFISSGLYTTNCSDHTLTKRRWGRRLLQTGLLGLLCFHHFSPSLSVIALQKDKKRPNFSLNTTEKFSKQNDQLVGQDLDGARLNYILYIIIYKNI